MQSNKIKEFCEEIFDGYNITDLKIEGDDVVMKVKPKVKISDELLVIFDRLTNPDINLNFGRPAEV